MTLAKLKEMLKMALLIISIIGLPNLFWNVRLLLRESTYTATELRRGSTSLADFAEFQTAQLQSERSQKIINANLELGATAKGSLLAFNRLILPRLAKTLDESQNLLLDTRRSVVATENLIAQTNRRLNDDGGLLPEATLLIRSLSITADRFGFTIESLDKSLQMIAEKAGLSLDEIYKLLASPEWLQTLKHLESSTANFASTSRHVDRTAAEIEKAMQSAPEIAKALERISKTSSKYQKALLLVSILSTLARAFLF